MGYSRISVTKCNVGWQERRLEEGRAWTKSFAKRRQSVSRRKAYQCISSWMLQSQSAHLLTMENHPFLMNMAQKEDRKSHPFLNVSKEIIFKEWEEKSSPFDGEKKKKKYTFLVIHPSWHHLSDILFSFALRYFKTKTKCKIIYVSLCIFQAV